MVASVLKQLVMQTVHILQLDSPGTDTLPKWGFLLGNPNLLPSNLTRRQYYCYTCIPMEAATNRDGFITMEARLVLMETA